MSISDGIERVRDLFRSSRQGHAPIAPQLNYERSREGGIARPAEEIHVPDLLPANPPNRSYMQWHEDDPERWSIEREAMSKRGYESGILRDGRACFVKKAQGEQNYDVAVICDWSYPQRPPHIFVEGDNLDEALRRNPDGSIDVFSNSRGWSPNMAAITVVDYLESKVDFLRELKGVAMATSEK